MAVALHAPVRGSVSTRRRRLPVSDSTVALLFALLPIILFGALVAFSGANMLLNFAMANIG